MLVSSTAAAAIAGTLNHRKKPYFVALAQELIASMPNRLTGRRA
jgi:hypothetical protein